MGDLYDDPRDVFCEALEAYYKQRGRGKTAGTLKKACRSLFNCPDVLPGSDCDLVADLVGVEPRGYSYASAARQIYKHLK